ncbi:lipopolysaccharide biosynthesis protein [Caballeronia pedi]|uniref:Lipopolysaccharide biosynthesis protein n=1 Tax=Caballeronia pedi TaxID=1777141 RepID=A0A158E0T5_9BURK|nr:chain-length determining protein [Caballeronia pedi]SAL00373.1 lipopolysaccharide biosynthesis protein [Caballeronia pedi]
MKYYPSDVLLRATQTFPRATARLRTWRRHWLKLLVLVAILGASAYWGCIASDRYVAEMHVVVQRTDSVARGPSGDLLSVISGSNESRDLLLFKDRLLSLDMMRRLDKKLHLREHFSDSRHDLFSRLWDRDASDERFYQYYLLRVTATYDDYSQLLVVRAQGYTPQMAQALAQALVSEGEADMNREDNQLAGEQVSFIEKQLVTIRDRMTAARQKLLEFQNRNGLVSPRATVQSVSEVVARLEAERADLTAKKHAMEGYLTANAPDMIEIDTQVAAIQRQIATEQGRLASRKGDPLNALVERQERLQAEAVFMEDVYKTALAALEKARVEATRKIKSVSILQSANLPQESLEPRRLYNVIVFAVVSVLIAGVIFLLGAIIRDHQD